MSLKRQFVIGMLIVILAGCANRTGAESPAAATASLEAAASPTASKSPTATADATPLPSALELDPAQWKTWPVQPVLTSRVLAIYAAGQELGNDPQAFSVFGDCQSHPNIFLGMYETDPQAVSQLPAELQETVAYFSGSFNRESPTVRDGTTAGGLLYPPWHLGMYGCGNNETPVDCELRLHNPSFAFINVGTHWVTRNQEYLRTIIEQLISAGVVPILVTKADDRLQGEMTNSDLAILAAEYDLPVWNFWLAVNDLPNHGLYTMPGQGGLGDVYLTDEALQIYRLDALQVLNLLMRTVLVVQ